MRNTLAPVSLLVASLLAGCAVQFGADDDTATQNPNNGVGTPTPTAPQVQETPTQPAPTPVPTPEPTPTPRPPSGYRVSSWSLSATSGVDLDDDGDVDNDFIPVYEASITVIANAVFSESYEVLSAQGMPIEQARLIALQLSATVADYYSVDNFNALWQRAIFGEYYNLVQLVDDGGSSGLSWYTAAAFEPGAYGVEQSVGFQRGAISGTAGRFGPDPLDMDLTDLYGAPGETQLLVPSGTPVIYLDVAVTELLSQASGFPEATVGGVFWEDDLRDYILALVPSQVCAPSGTPCLAFDVSSRVQTDLDQLFLDMEGLAMWTVDNGSALGVPVGFDWSADYVPVLEDW